MGKPANDAFDAKAFLAKVGAGKQVFEFRYNFSVCLSKAMSPTRCFTFKKEESN